MKCVIIIIILTAVAKYCELCEKAICVIPYLAYLKGSAVWSSSVMESRTLTDPFTNPTAVNKKRTILMKDERIKIDIYNLSPSHLLIFF